MKTIIKNSLYVGAFAMALTACSDNSWNDHLDGFEGGVNSAQVKTVDYTLTDADYERLAKNRFNVALAKEQGVSSELAAVGTQHYLNPSIPGAEYIPNLLKDSLFGYFGLSDGSAINLTYREISTDLPEMMKINGAQRLTLNDQDYQEVYGSATDYAPSFTPSHPAATFLPRLLNDHFDEASKGDYLMVRYNTSEVDPDFGEKFELTSVISNSLKSGDQVEICAMVTGLCTRGMIVTDKSGSLLVYSGSFPADTYNVGDQLKINATLSAYKNCLQVDYDNSTIVSMGKETVTYPTPVELTESYLVSAGEITDPVCAVYGHMTGTVSVSGNYYNILLGDDAKARGSVYYASDELKAKLTDGAKVSLLGYFTQTSTSGDMTNANLVVVDVESASAAAKRRGPKKVVTVPSTTVDAIYTFSGSAWSQVTSDLTVLQPSDYTAMGQSYGNLSGTLPTSFLPTYLKQKFPYAQKGDVEYVAYLYYASGSTTPACTQFTYDGSDWVDTIAADGLTTVTNQYVRRDGKWQLDPSIEFTLVAGRNQAASAKFYQACVDWVIANVPDGSKYVTSYGNNDYYTGASAYQNNIDLRPNSARNQYPEGYEGMTDEEIVQTMKKRFEDQVCPGVLSQFYPDMAPIGDLQPTVTIHFSIYTGTTVAETIVFKCVEKGKFEFVSCTWNDVE